MKMFSKTGDPCEGLGRLHRLEAGNQRQWHNALKELRLSKETRNRVAAGQNAIAYYDIVHWVEFGRAFCERHGVPLKPVDDSNPIPVPDAPEAPGIPPPDASPTLISHFGGDFRAKIQHGTATVRESQARPSIGQAAK